MLLALALLVTLFLTVAGVAYLATAARPDRGGAISIAWTLVAAYALLLLALLYRCAGERLGVKLFYASVLALYVANAALVAPRAHRHVIDGRGGVARYMPTLLIGAALAAQAALLWRVGVWLSCARRGSAASSSGARSQTSGPAARGSSL
jgi:hypothetical protein